MYAGQSGADYGYPRPPPSSPIDEAFRCSLPSISNLLVVLDAGSPTTEQSPASLQQQQTQSTKTDTGFNSSHCASNGLPRAAMPPTPPMSTDASCKSRGFPSTRSLNQVSAVSVPNHYYEATPPLENEIQMPAASVARVPIQALRYVQQAFTAPSYMSQPALSSYGPCTGPLPTQPQTSGLPYQRSLPRV
ncbi:hypothetical protein JX266_014110 [Neoarthrinium moseri]|nr:hypothetical protein JX266_014110 [Neoarthrinium moseri]